jgi:hypothetical protein
MDPHDSEIKARKLIDDAVNTSHYWVRSQLSLYIILRLIPQTLVTARSRL